jgi:hypothetical protein
LRLKKFTGIINARLILTVYIIFIKYYVYGSVETLLFEETD